MAGRLTTPSTRARTGSRLARFLVNPTQDGAHGRRIGSGCDRLGGSERAELSEDTAERRGERPAALATREVARDALARARVELVVDVVGQMERRLMTGRDPGPQ
jgi:hypothetical protein